jgi:hypothetical protein
VRREVTDREEQLIYRDRSHAHATIRDSRVGRRLAGRSLGRGILSGCCPPAELAGNLSDPLEARFWTERVNGGGGGSPKP